jgi:hypothetical protein
VTIKGFELLGADSNISTLNKLRCALEAAGVEFYDEDEGGPGVRLPSPKVRRQPSGRTSGGEGMNSPMQTDTTLVTSAIRKLISAGVSEEELVTTVMQTFPTLSVVELSAALQDATAAAEKQATRRRWWQMGR